MLESARKLGRERGVTTRDVEVQRKYKRKDTIPKNLHLHQSNGLVTRSAVRIVRVLKICIYLVAVSSANY